MSERITDFVRFELLKASVGMEADAAHDAKLREAAVEANQDVDARIKPYADSIPFEPGTPLHGQLAKAAMHNARRLWFNHIRQHKLEEAERQQYEAKMEVLVASIIADRGTRRRAVMVSADPREGRLLLPSQKETFILDAF